MRKIISIIFISMFISSFAQEQPRNRFDEPDQMYDTQHTEPNADGEEVNRGPGNPGDPTPIDMYIPFLMLTAAGIIVYVVRKKTKSLS